MIDEFKNEYAFLSNFYPHPVVMYGDTYPTVEHAFQAAKTLDEDQRRWIRDSASPGQAKRRGRALKLRGDWELVKIRVMRTLVERKFAEEPLRSRLLATGDEELVEGNTWGDTYWGMCRGKGENHLGLLLMQTRSLLRSEDRARLGEPDSDALTDAGSSGHTTRRTEET